VGISGSEDRLLTVGTNFLEWPFLVEAFPEGSSQNVGWELFEGGCPEKSFLGNEVAPLTGIVLEGAALEVENIALEGWRCWYPHHNHVTCW
jgi:hypothetical protein